MGGGQRPRGGGLCGWSSWAPTSTPAPPSAARRHGEGVTALHIAAQAGQTAAVEALLAAGADPTLRDALYDGPASGWARQGGHTALAALLREREE